VVEFGGDLLFLGPDGIRPISGTDKIGDVELATVSKEIQSIFDNYYLIRTNRRCSYCST